MGVGGDTRPPRQIMMTESEIKMSQTAESCHVEATTNEGSTTLESRMDSKKMKASRLDILPIAGPSGLQRKLKEMKRTSCSSTSSGRGYLRAFSLALPI